VLHLVGVLPGARDRGHAGYPDLIEEDDRRMRGVNCRGRSILVRRNLVRATVTAG
jgi:hypothetical protein